MFNSPFNIKKSFKATIEPDCEVIFVADMFASEYAGGAELTTQALVDSSPLKVGLLKSPNVTMALLEEHQDKFWIFGNYAALNLEIIPTIVANLNYSILEYDYKYCQYRSPEKHAHISGKPCDCHHSNSGKMISAFMYGARALWWMSERQMERYHTLFPFLSQQENLETDSPIEYSQNDQSAKPNCVLSSVFDNTFFVALKNLREKYSNKERRGWIALGSTSWIKGAQDAEQWCKDNQKDYEVIWDVPYDEVLEKLAQAEGFVYLPKGGDTCPRMVIEAKLLGCELYLNDDVEHAKELWFDTDDMFDTEAYLYAARERFWTGIKQAMEWRPTLSGYTTTRNCITHDYPWRESISSMIDFCDEVIVVDGGSNDGTWEELEKWSEQEIKLKVYKIERDWTHPRFAVFDGMQKAEARSKCTADFCWQQDADEIVHENDHKKILGLMRSFPSQVDLVSLPVIEYWGSEEKVRLDINPWKWRLSRNKPHITHGIPGQLRSYDESGSLYAKLGTDGCDYVDNKTGEVIAHASFYNNDAHKLKAIAMQGDKKALDMYQDWFARNIELLPSVHHFSWFNLERKIRTYREYWQAHWESLYDIEQQDTAKNNMFFQKPWSEVTDENIRELALGLKEKMGGWVFHEPVDFSTPTPWLALPVDLPCHALKYVKAKTNE